MNSECEIVMKIRESKELDESSFESGGHTYKSVFGKYYMDDKQISRDEYFKAKDGGSIPTSSSDEDLDSQAKEMFKYSTAPDGSNPEMERFQEIEDPEEKVRFLKIAKVTYDLAEKGKELWDVDRQLAKEYIDYLSVGDPKILDKLEKGLGIESKPKSEGMSFEDVQALAKEHYKNGGDSFYETWDEKQFEDYVKEHGPMTKEKALSLFRTYKETEDHPEDGESGLLQSTERFLDANPHYDMFDEEDFEHQIRGYSNAIKDIEATFEYSGDKDLRKKSYNKLAKKFSEFEKHAPQSLKKQVDFIRGRLEDVTEDEPVKKDPYEDYKPEQFDHDMDEFEADIDDILRTLPDVHPEEREEYIDKLASIADKLDRMEEYLTDEQYEKSEELMDQIRRAEDAPYEGPSIHKYDDPYASRGLRREDFY